MAYRRVDGFRIAASKAALLANGPTVSLHVDETGGYIQAIPSTLTGTDETGQAAASHCLNWSSGDVSEGSWRGYASLDSNGHWTDHSELSCNQNGRFYCFSNVVHDLLGRFRPDRRPEPLVVEHSVDVCPSAGTERIRPFAWHLRLLVCHPVRSREW